MYRPGRNIAAFSCPVSGSSAANRQRHLSFEDNVRGLYRMSMIRITAVRPVLPNIGMPKPLVVQLTFEFVNVYRSRLTS